MNDENNLYLALKIMRSSFGGATNPSFEFDNDHDGIREDSDDVFGMAVGIFQAPTFVDAFRFTCPGALPGSAACGPADSASIAGFPPRGTNDGTTGASNDGSFTYVELSHPLDSADDLHDFSLSPGDTVGFQLNLRLFNLSLPFDSFADTRFLTGLLGDIMIASPVIGVAIDIKPGTFPNTINRRSRGSIRVAILSTTTFDAPARVAPSSLTFGRTGDEPSLAFCSPSPEDVNGDGLLDVVCHFDTSQSAFQPEDTVGVLKGTTMDGTAIVGSDSVRIMR